MNNMQYWRSIAVLAASRGYFDVAKVAIVRMLIEILS